MSVFLKECIPRQTRNITINKENMWYSENVLISLGLDEDYIIKNNYLFFGKDDLEDQELIKEKFLKIEEEFKNFFNVISKKYNMKALVFEFSNVYTKLLDISLNNDNCLMKADDLNTNDISYTARASELMRRKIKYLIEMIILRNNKIGRSNFTNKDYKKFIILLYYHSIYIFYTKRSELSHNLENSITDFVIYPKELNCIITYIRDKANENDNEVHYNFQPNENFVIDDEFNNAFLEAKGILFEDYLVLSDNLIGAFENKKINNVTFTKDTLTSMIKSLFPNMNMNKFYKECVLTKDSFEYDENNLYKNTCKHRLDTTPVVLLEDDCYFINKGFISSSKQFWCNVCLLGLKPYYDNNADAILKSVEKIVIDYSDKFEDAVAEIIMKVYPNVILHQGVKTHQIFKGRNLDDNEWDIIAIEHNKKCIFDIEVKYVTTSMTESSLANDLKKFVGEGKNYQEKFEKRISYEKMYSDDFFKYCEADNSYKIIRIMVTSKIMDLDTTSSEREFVVIDYKKLNEFIKRDF